MSCIDAAIIKALVEHIGGNPDDVVVGGGSSNSDIPLDNISWKIENRDLGNGEQPIYVARVSRNNPIKPGAILKVKYYLNSVSTNFYLCTDHDIDNGILYFTDLRGEQKLIATMLDYSALNSTYDWGFDFWTVGEESVPDQITTGVFHINTFESARYACGALAGNTSSRLRALEAKQ